MKADRIGPIGRACRKPSSNPSLLDLTRIDCESLSAAWRRSRLTVDVILVHRGVGLSLIQGETN